MNPCESECTRISIQYSFNEEIKFVTKNQNILIVRELCRTYSIILHTMKTSHNLSVILLCRIEA